MKWALASLLFLPLLVLSQSSSGTPTFDVADVHPSPPAAMAFFDSGFLPNGRYQIRNATLVDLVATAWSLDNESVIGGPPWLGSDRFDVIAKASLKSTEAERKMMLRSLLAERFKLAVHSDKKELDVYALTVGKRGAQFQKSGTTTTVDCKPSFDPGPPQMVTVTCPSITMPEFARQLRQMAGGYIFHQVADFTGLEGPYTLTVKWSPRGAPKSNDAGEPITNISIFEALDKQLGINLEQTRRAVPVMVVDHVEQTPTPDDPDALKNLPATTTEFEAATIKVNKSGKQIRRIEPKPGGRIEVENVPLRMLISLAWNFDFDTDRIVGLPKWAETDSEAYDIIAKTAILPGEKAPPFDDVRLMIRSLLIERFQMKVREDQQPVKVWTLTVGKRGPKMKEADPAARSTCRTSVGQTGSGAAALPAINYICQNTTMAQLAVAMHQVAGGYVDHPVFDMTGLKGGYDFTITWTPKNSISPNRQAQTAQAQADQSGAASDPSGGTTFFDPVEKQLGLHLEAGQKHTMPVLVIDHIEPLGLDN